MTKDTGGSAFPQAVATLASGMTLRDYFAAKAMQGILASSAPITRKIDVDQLVAVVAYKIADAMLKAREE